MGTEGTFSRYSDTPRYIVLTGSVQKAHLVDIAIHLGTYRVSTEGTFSRYGDTPRYTYKVSTEGTFSRYSDTPWYLQGQYRGHI